MTFSNLFFLILIYVPLIMLWIFTLTDLARRTDISGVAKGFWAVAIVLLPIVGMLVYFIARPHDEVAVEPSQSSPDNAGSLNITDDHIAELEKLDALRKSGALTDDEFAKMKAQVLG